MAKKKRRDDYGDTFKVTAVELGDLPGVYAQDVAKVLDIHPVMLYRWKKQYREGFIVKKKKQGTLESEHDLELNRLRKIEKVYERLKMQHDLLKKNIRYCSVQKKKFSNS